MARTPHHDTHTRHTPGTAHARQRIAAQRAAQQRAQARRRLLAPVAAAAAVLAIVAAFVTVKLTTGAATTASESPAPQSIVSQVTNVPPAVLGQVRGGGTATPLHTVKKPGPALSIAGSRPSLIT